MMPKGVEHTPLLNSLTPRILVSLPMMPKGVEHNPCRYKSSRHSSVSLPMMPKGVEHNKLNGGRGELSPGESSDDAERR